MKTFASATVTDNCSSNTKYLQQPITELFQKRRKAQITSSPGIPPGEKCRYRVTLGGKTLGDKLSIEQALEIAGLEVKS